MSDTVSDTEDDGTMNQVGTLELSLGKQVLTSNGIQSKVNFLFYLIG